MSGDKDCRLCGGPVEADLNEGGTRLSVSCKNPQCGPHIIHLADWHLYEEWLNVNPKVRAPRLKLAVYAAPESEVPVLDLKWLEALTARLTPPSEPPGA